MATTLKILLILNALFFLFYGFQALFSQFMIDEFKRFGMTDPQRRMTGVLQVLGAAGLFAGLNFPYIGLMASAGFTAMMSVAFIVRIKIKDSIAQSVPSLVFMLINMWLMVTFFRLL